MDTIRKGWLTELQIQELLAKEDNPRYHALWVLMADCGLRIAEALALRMRDVVETGEVAKVIRVKGKGKKIRYVAMTARVQLALKELLSSHGLYFKHKLFPIGARAAQIRFKNVAAAAGLKGYLSPHSLRHSFATRLLDGGQNIYQVQQLMGHETIKTTEKYLHLNDNALGAARAVLDNTTTGIRTERMQGGLKL